MSVQVIELAEQIKEKGRKYVTELPELLRKAEELAKDDTQDMLTRALAYRAAGNAYQLLNQFQPALEKYDLAVTILDTLNEPIELGRTLHAKVGMLFFLSRYDELFECSSRARRLFEKFSDRKRLARLDVNLAHAYHRLGRHKEALDCSERAVAVLHEIGDVEGFVSASINSGVTLMHMHDFELAEERYRTAMESADRSNLSSWVLICRYHLAFLRYLSGDTATALRKLDQARKEYERLNDEWMICHCWLHESEILLEVGDLEDSILAARAARSLAGKLHLNSEVAESLLYEAAAGLRLGRDDEALTLLNDATRRFSAEGDKVSAAVSKLQTALFRGERGQPGALFDAVSARSELLESGLPHRMALAEIVVGRIQRANGELDCALDSFKSGLVFAEGSRSQWMQFHAYYELGLTLNRKGNHSGIELFRRADNLLDSLWSRLGSDDLKMMFLADRENVYTHLVKATIAESPEGAFTFSEKARSRVLRERLVNQNVTGSVSDIVSRLSREESLVEYFISGDDVFIFVLTRAGLFTAERRGAVPALKTLLQYFERHIDSCSVKWERLAPVRRHLDATVQAHLQSLYQELIAPVEAQLRETVVFAPHGFLHNVPLHALHDGKQYLTERHKVAYTPSALLYCSPAARQEFGSPLFIAFSTGTDCSSADEVSDSAAQVKGSAILVNPSMEELRHAFEQPRSLIHIAGHAGIDTVGGKLSWIQTSEGRLTSRDLSEMHIRAKTLVITGCQSARRMIRAGDEWLGLMRSFYLAGASTIVSALWDIRDESARRFAREFYKGFDGKDAPAAVQRAALALRGWRTHPYFWSGFGAFIRKEQEQ